MLGFTPFKRRANKFNYVPRYYDPEKEAREQRRAELHGQRADDGEQEYRPGQFIRTQREARAERRANEMDKNNHRIWKMAAGAVLVLLFIYLAYPKLADVIMRMQTGRQPVRQEVVQEEFDPYAPITIVPNDYKEE